MSDNIKVRIVNGKTYKFKNDKWINERSNIELDPHDPDYRIIWNIKQNSQ
tara:strand:- start:1377 stop:1526 length:150 start_codon:yes stop_codon:yes gene_type:complete